MEYVNDGVVKAAVNATASREPEVRRALVRLHNAINENEKAVSVLAERLTPVTRPVITKDDSCEKQAYACEISGKINEYIEMIDAITRRINAAISGLEI